MMKRLNTTKTIEEIQDIVNTLYPNEYKILEYINSSKPMMVLHIKCNTIYRIGKANTFTNEGKCRCKVCYSKKINEKELKDSLKLYRPDIEYIGGFKSIKSKILVKCLKCTKEFYAFYGELKRKRTTHECIFNTNRGKYLLNENILQECLDNREDGIEYQWLDNYKNNNKLKYKILHKVCNQIYSVRVNDFQQGYSCPYCSRKVFKPYSEFKKYLTILNINFIEEFKDPTLKLKLYLSIDFYLPDYNLCIELDGIQHFTNKTIYGKNRLSITNSRDSAKNKWCIDNNKSILRIPFDVPFNIFYKVLNALDDNLIFLDIVREYKLYYYSYNNRKLYNRSMYYIKRNKLYFDEIAIL
jgi:hypothetical protein